MKLKESPEAVKTGEGEILHWSDKGAYAFGFDEDRNAYISSEGGRHANMKDTYLKDLGRNDYPDDIWSRDGFLYPGRFWRTHNIISFWKYPDVHMLFAYLKKLEDEFRERFPNKKPLDFKNQTWYINKWTEDNPHIENASLGEFEGFSRDTSSDSGGFSTHTSNLVEEKRLRKVIRSMIKKVI